MFVSSTHQLILISGDCDEDGFRKDKRLEVCSEFHDVDEGSAIAATSATTSAAIGRARMILITLLGDVNARLVLVHAV